MVNRPEDMYIDEQNSDGCESKFTEKWGGVCTSSFIRCDTVGYKEVGQ